MSIESIDGKKPPSIRARWATRLFCMCIDFWACFFISEVFDVISNSLGLEMLGQSIFADGDDPHNIMFTTPGSNMYEMITFSFDSFDGKISCPITTLMISYIFQVYYVLHIRELFSPGSKLLHLDMINVSGYSKTIDVYKCLVITCWKLPIDFLQIAAPHSAFSIYVNQYYWTLYWALTIISILMLGSTLEEYIFSVQIIEYNTG